MSYHIKVKLIQADVDAHQAIKADYVAWEGRVKDHHTRYLQQGITDYPMFEEKQPAYGTCWCCPWANAISRTLGQKVTVTNKSWWPTAESRNNPYYVLPKEAQDWIAQYDRGGEVPPLIEVDFEIPAHLMPVGSL